MSDSTNKDSEALSKISQDRTRTNLLKKYEQRFIAYLVQHVPQWMSSDMLTLIGFIGSIIISLSFIFATYVNRYYLLLGVLGFAINWFGDSLDGRLAYYRNKPRKWYGFSLDFTVDWLTNIIIGIGFALYIGKDWQLIVFLFIMLYGWAMIMALLRYKIVNKYTIDTSSLGPTEVRIIISAIMVVEIFFPYTVMYLGGIASIVLLIVNIVDFIKLLKMADEKDIEERKEKESN